MEIYERKQWLFLLSPFQFPQLLHSLFFSMGFQIKPSEEGRKTFQELSVFHYP